MKKFIAYAFAGPLARHVAGERVLNDKERWSLIVMIYSLTAGYAYYQWKANQVEEDALEDVAARSRITADWARASVENQTMRETLAVHNIPLPKTVSVRPNTVTDEEGEGLEIPGFVQRDQQLREQGERSTEL